MRYRTVTALLWAAALSWPAGAGAAPWQTSARPEGAMAAPPARLGAYPIAENTERLLPPDEVFTLWIQDEAQYRPAEEDRVEVRRTLVHHAETFKLDNVVPPIGFDSGRADIPESYTARLKEVLDGMQHRANVRLHFIGHTDDEPLGPASAAQYGDNVGLSRARAAIAAEYFQRALGLAPESVSYDGVGASHPIAGNDTRAGKARNRRVEVQVWYDEVTEQAVDEEVVIPAPRLNRIEVCRKETVCKLHYRQGSAKRARLKNLVPPLRLGEGQAEVPPEYLRQIGEIVRNLGDKHNVVLRFVGHTDSLPLGDIESRIYGNHEAFSKARAQRVALAVQDALGLPGTAVSSDGKGASTPVAANDTMQGRALNRRVELEFWYDDPYERPADEPQACPEAAAAETVTLAYEPPDGPIEAIRFAEGRPLIPPGYAARLKRLLDEVGRDKANTRLNFVGFTGNRRMERRIAMVYGDDIGLSTARARRVMEAVKQEQQLGDRQVQFEGRGFVSAKDPVNAGFGQLDDARVEVEILYDELAVLDEDEGLEITRIERRAAPRNPYALNLMRITVDGEPVHDPYKHVADLQRCTDVALAKADIRFRFDNLGLKPRLNVSAWPTTVRYRDDAATPEFENRVGFRGYGNYRAFLNRAEVRIFTDRQSTRDRPLAVVALDADWKGEWQADLERFAAPLQELKYLLRVYDEHGVFDETGTQSLWLVDELETADEAEDAGRELLVGYGENRLALQNIPLRGGTVAVHGERIPAGHQVWIAGRPVPVGAGGRFAGEEIVPAGFHTMEVAVLDGAGNGELFLRELEMEKNDWFYLGLADLTLSKDATNGPAALVTGDRGHYDNDLNVDGRLAFYTKGKFDRGWELTASADTREAPLGDLFKNFTEKSPDMLFRRLDPDYYYPAFGDDSTAEEDAPTLGKFYLKMKKQQTYGLWGNFDIEYTGNDLAHIDRGLYGANGHFEGQDLTAFGEKRLAIDGFAAEPGTVAGRDEFRGTGGSLYFLRHQDVLTGSDRVRIEIRDKDSGLVIAAKHLVAAVDYDLDYIQGRILLSAPLAATADDSLLVESGSFGGNPVYLVVRYEYTPGFDDLNDAALGARMHYWFDDRIKLGLTASEQRESDNEQSLSGVDLTLRKTAGTWVKMELAATQGQGTGALNSNDGGFSYEQMDQGLGGGRADAYRIEANARLSDLFAATQGNATFYRQSRAAGFSAPGQLTATAVEQIGASLRMPVTGKMDVSVKADRKEQQRALETSALDLEAGYRPDDHWRLRAASRFDAREDRAAVPAATQQEGERVDVALEAAYDSLRKWTVYGFGQVTAAKTGNRDGNNRVGTGGSYRATDRLRLDGEISAGDLGTGARLGTDYLVSDRSNLYLNYALENERTDNGVRARRGNMSSGFRTRYSDSASVFMEERYTHGDVPTGLTHALGVDLAPSDRWNFGANIEIGTLEDEATAAATQRRAFGLGVGYGFDAMTYAGALEYRRDETENAAASVADRTTLLFRNSLKYQLSPSSRLIGKLNLSDSKSSQGEFYDGNFVDAVLGYGYRPVANDRWNTLVKYAYFYNMPTADQVTVQNTAVEFIQKSRILSLDAVYDLSRRWTVGGKYAYRLGQVSQERVDPQFFASRAGLYVLRADWHAIHRWDLLVEGRLLDLPDAQDRRGGALIATYRHIGRNAKFGLGYNFTDFSDDLTDLDFDNRGFFINLVGKI